MLLVKRAVREQWGSPMGRHDLRPCVLVRVVQEEVVVDVHLVLLAIIVLPSEHEDVCAVLLQATRQVTVRPRSANGSKNILEVIAEPGKYN